MTTARQLAALLRLQFRSWWRRPLKAGAAPTRGRMPSFLLIAPLWFAYLGAFLWQLCRAPASLGGDRPAVAAWQLLGVAMFMGGVGLSELAPEVGRQRTPMRAALLDELPVGAPARVLFAWLSRAPIGVLTLVATLAWSHGAPGGLARVAWAAAVAIALHAACIAAGYALATWVRVLAPPPWRRTLAFGSLALMLGGILMLSSTAVLRPLATKGFAPPPGLGPFAAELVEGRGPLMLGGAAVLLALSAGAIAAGELLGYDRLDAAPARVKRQGGKLTLRGVEWRMAWREKGAVLVVMNGLLAALIAGAVLFAAWQGAEPLSMGVKMGYAPFAGYLGVVTVLGFAGQAVRRDVAARALLAPLPLSPYDTLGVKVAVARRAIAPFLLASLFVAAAVLARSPWLGAGATARFLWLVATTSLALWFSAHAAVSIAFLTDGVGLPGARPAAASGNIASLLLFMPVMATATARDAFAGAVALAGVAVLAGEARRAASKRVLWLDDPADDAERETTVWRALLALSTFSAVQGFGAQLLRITEVPPALTLSISYVASGALLVLLTRSGRRGLRPLRLWPGRLAPAAVAAGAAGGAASAGFALAFGAMVARVFPPDGAAGGELGDLTGWRLWALAAALVVAAPVAEEVFFRGWLQDAVEADLPDGRKRWAFAIAAAAFGLAHVGGYAVPQIVLGLVAGWLYARSGGLLPGLVAHAVHNGVVLWSMTR